MSELSQDIKLTNTVNPVILNLSSYHPLENAILSINKYQKVKPLNINNLVGSGEANVAIDLLATSNYLIIKTGQVHDSYFPSANYVLLDATVNTVNANWVVLKKSFVLIKRISIPLDKSFVEIYRRKEMIEEGLLVELGETIKLELNQKITAP